MEERWALVPTPSTSDELDVPASSPANVVMSGCRVKKIKKRGTVKRQRARRCSRQTHHLSSTHSCVESNRRCQRAWGRNNGGVNKLQGRGQSRHREDQRTQSCHGNNPPSALLKCMDLDPSSRPAAACVRRQYLQPSVAVTAGEDSKNWPQLRSVSAIAAALLRRSWPCWTVSVCSHPPPGDRTERGPVWGLLPRRLLAADPAGRGTLFPSTPAKPFYGRHRRPRRVPDLDSKPSDRGLWRLAALSLIRGEQVAPPRTSGV
jgi:hypothetical protein